MVALAAAALVGTVAFIADELREGESFRLDRVLLLAFRTPADVGVPIGPRWLEQSAIDVSALGGFTLLWLLGGATVVFLWIARHRAEALLLASSIVGASLLSDGLKSLLHRARPDVVPHLAVVSSASFPSGHAMISAALYLTIGAMLAEVQTRRAVKVYVMVAVCLLVVLIGVSRVYLGVHWPSDVLAGWCLGATWAIIVVVGARLVRARLSPMPSPARTAP